MHALFTGHAHKAWHAEADTRWAAQRNGDIHRPRVNSKIVVKKVTSFEMAYPVTNSQLLLELELQTKSRIVLAG